MGWCNQGFCSSQKQSTWSKWKQSQWQSWGKGARRTFYQELDWQPNVILHKGDNIGANLDKSHFSLSFLFISKLWNRLWINEVVWLRIMSQQMWMGQKNFSLVSNPTISKQQVTPKYAEDVVSATQFRMSRTMLALPLLTWTTLWTRNSTNSLRTSRSTSWLIPPREHPDYVIIFAS